MFRGLSIGFIILASLPLAAQATTLSLGLTTANIAEFTGEAANDIAGYSVASAGDVDGDGYNDFLIGAYQNSDGASYAGAVYLVYGQSTPLTSASLSTAVQFTGEGAEDYMGTSVASAGDVNNDGYDDILIGASDADSSFPDAGSVYLIYGQSAHLSSASLSTAIEFTGEAEMDRAGYSLASGDVNNDGYDDILIGALTNDEANEDAGAAYLIYGQPAHLTSDNLSAAIKFTGEAEFDYAATAIAMGGDVNNDGYDDILIGAGDADTTDVDAGITYLIYGQPTHLADASLSTAIKFTGEAESDLAGNALAFAGDVNNDGNDEILIGAANNNDAAAGAGATYLIYGQLAPLSNASLSSAIKFTGEAAVDYAGTSVASAGDVNNDGYDDLLIGAVYNNDAASDAGAVYLVYGRSTALTSASLNTALEFTGEAMSNYVGSAVASAGDVNNDGYDDLLIGANGNDDGGSDAGAAYVVYAQPSTVSITNNTSLVNTIECAVGAFSDPGATATDQYTSSSLSVSTVDTIANTPAGTDTVTYTTAINTLRIAGSATRTVTIADTIDPVLTLTGNATVTVQQGATYSDAGATVSDTCDSSIAINTVGTVNTAVPGNYILTYNASDDSGNAATPVTRTVTVEVAATEDEEQAEDEEVIEEEDDATPPAHGNIITATKQAGEITIVYGDDHTESITPFGGDRQFVLAVTRNRRAVVVTNGKFVRVFVDGERVAQKKINNKKLRARFISLKVRKLYRNKGYKDIMILLAKKQVGQVNHLRLTADYRLTKFKYKQQAITERQPRRILARPFKHRFTTRFGNDAERVRTTWKVTPQGKLKSI